MSTADSWMYGANDGAPKPDDGWSRRPRYALSDFVTLLWRERYLMGAIFTVIFALGLAYALTMKTTYTAYSQILVRLGTEYVYQPAAGDAARGAISEPDAVVASEQAILTSGPVMERVVDRIGADVLYPDIKSDGTEAGDRTRRAKAIQAMAKAFATETAPDLPNIQMSFYHENPDMAARVLNTIMEEYLVYRRTVLMRSTAPAITAERARSENELSQVDTSLQEFLTANGIGDFETEKATLALVLSDREQQRYTISSALRERRGRLSALNGDLRGMSQEREISRDLNVEAEKALADKRLERARLSATYAEGSAMLTRLDAEITDLQRALTALPQPGASARRVGPNPIFQTLETERIQVQAEVAAREEELNAVTAQIEQITARQLELAALEPQFRALTRDQLLLQENVRQFGQKELETLSNEAIAQVTNDNIRMVNRAEVPSQGSSKRKLVGAMVLIFAAFTALCAGLLRIFMGTGLPTAAAAGRTLDLPVLATARVKAA